jgi:hypothetical protein
MFSWPIFFMVLALICLFDVFVLCVMGMLQHRWLPFRLACAVVASLCAAAFAAIIFS